MNKVNHMVALSSERYHQTIKKIAQPLDILGINYFCYQYVSNQGDWFTLGNHPEWLHYCADNQFYQYDPSLTEPRHSKSGLILPAEYTEKNFQETLVDKAINQFDINHCLAIVEKDLGGCAYYFLGAPQQHHKILSYYLQNADSLSTDFTAYVKTEINPIKDKCLADSINLHAFNSDQFTKNGQDFFDNESVGHFAEFFNKRNPMVALTPRETDCIRYYQQGFTAKETAKVLNISNRTIEDHFEKIKSKLNLTFKRELLNFYIH